MKIKVTSLYVDDQDKALRFYTEILGFAKKTDFSQGPYRWLTVASPEEPEGTELQLALNNNPAAKTYQQAIFQQNQPAAMFFTDDVKRDYERIKARGAEFTMPPTDVTGSTIAMLKDTCGNLRCSLTSTTCAAASTSWCARAPGHRQRSTCSTMTSSTCAWRGKPECRRSSSATSTAVECSLRSMEPSRSCPTTCAPSCAASW